MMKDKRVRNNRRRRHAFASGFVSTLLLVGVVSLAGIVSLFGLADPVFANEMKGEGASVKISGEFRTRGFYTSDLLPPSTNGNGKDTEAFGDLRFRLKTAVTSEVATGVIVADFANGFCAPSVATVQSAFPLDSGLGAANVDDAQGCPTGTTTTGNGRFGTGTAFGQSLNIVGVREAYLMVHLENFSAVGGRKHYRLGHGLVLDDTVTGVGARAHLGAITLTVADLNLADPLAGAGFAGTSNDSDLYLIKLTDAPKDAMGYGKEKYSVYIGHLTDPKGNLTYNGFGTASFGAGFDAKLNLIGAALKQYTYRENGPVIDFEVNYFNGEIAGAGAADPDISGLSALASLSVPLDRGNAGLTVVYGSGQDPAKVPANGGDLNVNALSGNYALGNILLNTSINSDRNGSGLDVGTRGIMAVELSADCVKDEKRMGVAIIWAKTTQNASTTVSSRDLGVEIDGNAAIKLDKNLELSAGIGYLIAGDAWKGLSKGDDGNAIRLHTAVVLTF